MKYMVMECYFSYAVVLDEDGKFLKVANRNYQVGQVVTDVMEMKEPQVQPQPQIEKVKKKNAHKRIYPIIAMAACVVFLVTAVLYIEQTPTPYASVYMSINPDVRIDIKRNQMVVGLLGENADGEQLVAGYSYKEKNLELVMDELVDRAIDMEFLSAGDRITLSLDAKDEEWVVSAGDAINKHLTEYLEGKVSVTIEVTPTHSKPSKDESESSGNQQIFIPIVPETMENQSEHMTEDSNYGESDYGHIGQSDSKDGDSDYEEEEEEDGDEDTDYEEEEDGDSAYEDVIGTELEEDGDTNYEEED